MKAENLVNNAIKARWQLIPKDKDGFFDDDSDLYEQLPIVVASIEEGFYPVLEYIDQDNWLDACCDLNKSNYEYYIRVETIEGDRS